LIPKAFPPYGKRLRQSRRRQAVTRHKNRGRLETRTLTVTTTEDLTVQWPGLQQVLKLERSVTVHGQTSHSTTYWITSVPPARLSARQLIEHIRDRWGIENSCFYVRDVTLHEDRCRLRTGHAAHNFSTARNTAIAYLKITGHPAVAPVLRQHLYTPSVLIRKINF
jgi:hypothetical protein